MKSRIVEEWFRSLRFGHGFSVSRIRIPAVESSDELNARLRQYLRKIQRNVDFLCEVREGVFSLLSPETERFPEGLAFRLKSLWTKENPEAAIEITQKIFPRDGQNRQVFLDFAAGKDLGAAG